MLRKRSGVDASHGVMVQVAVERVLGQERRHSFCGFAAVVRGNLFMRCGGCQVGDDFPGKRLRALGKVGEKLRVNLRRGRMHNLARKERTLVDPVARGGTAVVGFIGE